MADFRTMYDREYIFAYDLQGKDVTLQIARVSPGTLTGTGGKKSKKPVVYFDGKERGLALCKTNGKVIAAMYGTDTEQWVGKLITIYPTTTTFGPETVECIRVRPTVPKRDRKDGAQ